jgi:hypothetical protein
MVSKLRVATYRKAERQRSKFMEKTFMYQFETKANYLESSDEYEYDYEEYGYTVTNGELVYGVAHCVFDQYFRGKSEASDYANFGSAVIVGLREFIKDIDNLEQLVEVYESELKEYFEDDAYEEYKNRG